MSAEFLRSVRDHLSEVVDRVEHRHERVVITRNGRDAAVLISEATWSVGSTPCGSCSVTDEGPCGLVVTPPARRALTERLPETVAAAVINVMTTALVDQPRRVGKPLRGELVGLWSARRGTYRVVYRVVEEPREVVVVRVEHRRDVYRGG